MFLQNLVGVKIYQTIGCQIPEDINLKRIVHYSTELMYCLLRYTVLVD
jgi:hypothetical protein